MPKTVKSMDRIMSLDIIRIIAICAVVMIHASALCVTQNSPSSLSFIIGNLFDSISRLGVPLFFMISGALMLNESKKISFEKIIKRYVLNILLLLFFWSFLYAVLARLLIPLLQGEEISISDFFKSVISGHYHLWFLFAIIGLYLVTPILRTFVKRENKKYVEWFIFLGVVFNFFSNLISCLFTYSDKIFWEILYGVCEPVYCLLHNWMVYYTNWNPQQF